MVSLATKSPISSSVKSVEVSEVPAPVEAKKTTSKGKTKKTEVKDDTKE